MTTMHLEPNALPEIAMRVVRAAFPGYTGRKYAMRVADSVEPTSYWSGGSRDYWTFVRLTDMAVLPVPQNGTPFDGGPLPAVEIPAGVVAVQHSIFCGKDMGITFYVRDPELLPRQTVQLEPDQEIVLVYTRGLKSSHAGRSNLRFYEANRNTGITEPRWEAAKTACIVAGFLNKAGAITPTGRNVIEGSKVRV